MINLSSILWILYGPIVFKEYPNKRIILCTVFSFLGVIICVRPDIINYLLQVLFFNNNNNTEDGNSILIKEEKISLIGLAAAFFSSSIKTIVPGLMRDYGNITNPY
jgi:drug/metabolite transporter (DMT)-like permease